MTPPWWCCHGWSPQSLVCLTDNLAHRLFPREDLALPRPLQWICGAHDRLITGAAR